jgi:alpha-L-fucosidase 2
MNRKTKLLTLSVAVIIALVLLAAFFMETEGNSSAVRVACVGDSITLGTGYTIDLWHLLGSNYVVGNFGVDGATVYLHSGSAYMKQTAFQVAQQFKPSIVIIMLGTNDANPALNESNAVFIQDYVMLVNAFQGLASKPKLWIVKPPPIFNNTANLSGQFLMQNIIPDIIQVANQTHASLIDANTPLANNPKAFVDGVHPNAFGAQIIAVAIYKAVSTGKSQ